MGQRGKRDIGEERREREGTRIEIRSKESKSSELKYVHHKR